MVSPAEMVSHMRMRTCLRFKVYLIGRALRSKVRISRSAHNVVQFKKAACMTRGLLEHGEMSYPDKGKITSFISY